MASLIETLIDVLDKENTEYQGLLKLSEEKTTAMLMAMLKDYRKFLDLSKEALIRLINLMLSGMRMWEIYAMFLIFLEKE